MNKYDTYLQLEDKPTAFNSLSIPLFVGSGVFSYIKTKHVYHIDAQPEAYRCFWASSRSEAAHGEPFEEHKHIYIPPARGDAKLGSLQGKRTYLVSLLLNAPGVFAQKSSSLLIVLHMLIWYSTPYTQTLHGTGILVDQSGPMECLGY